MLKVSGIASQYGAIKAIFDVSLTVGSGELVAMVGANGAGKTTLLRAISGVQPVCAGSIQFDGRDVTRLAPHRIVAGGIGHVPEGRQVFAPMSVQDNLRLGAFGRRRDRAAVDADLERIYEMFPILGQRRSQPAGTLSGGEQQMLAIGRSLLGKPRLLLLDEPSMGLAPLLVEEIFRVIAELNSEGVTVLLVEQNARAALRIADRGYVLETGKVVMSAPARELLEDESVRKAYLGH
ncbi:MAG TPA: ABC transporter ATP-binding protein [Arenicellales bacterium]|nr:ABC transporter ATP-binding protein [Arenicellales bacterium]